MIDQKFSDASKLLAQLISISDLTATEVSAAADISKSKLSNWTTGRSEPKPSDLANVLDVIGYDLVARKRLSHEGLVELGASEVERAIRERDRQEVKALSARVDSQEARIASQEARIALLERKLEAR